MTHTSHLSRLDRIYRSVLLSRFFTKGWGRPEHLKRIFELRRRLATKDSALTHVDPLHPVTIVKDVSMNDHRLLEGYFRSPMADYLPELLPKESEKAHFQIILPLKWTNSRLKPVCIQYAGTGDHFFWRRRRLMGLPLLREREVASIILENPFYGLRKPKEQFRSCLQQVSDLFVMGAALILESLVLFHFCEREGFNPIIAHGISMGGHMASLGATVWDKPIGLVPCLSWTSGSLTFTKGVLTGAIPWDLLEKQYASKNAYKDEVVRLIEFEESAHRAGIDFAQTMDRIAQINAAHTNSLLQSQPDQHQLSKKAIENEMLKKELDPLLSPAPKNSMSWAKKLSFSISGSSKSDTVIPDLPKGYQMVPKLLRNDENNESHGLHREAVHFMRGIMDECTHLKNYDMPFDTSLINIVVAEYDAYQPRDQGISALPDIWPGSNIRYIEGKGHVSSYLFKQHEFRKAIYDCIDTYVAKYMQKS